MPVVPITSARPKLGGKGPVRSPPPEPFALMAAAQMHAEGRLIEPTGEAPSGTVPDAK